MIDTGNVDGRRDVHFSSLDEMLMDAENLAKAESAGKLSRVGNWTLGQACGHLAVWTNFAYDGYPMKVPFLIKMLIRPMKTRFIKGPIPAGKNLPGVDGGTFGTEALPTATGLADLKLATARLKSAPPKDPNPVFGDLQHDEWIALALRHAELHLSFFFATPT
ncbi:MAG: DUF1569 domain-containing protein [Tepidisphaeraceae bacterium]|jgi:hypothetical protein